jgi:hypothetical protein
MKTRKRIHPSYMSEQLSNYIYTTMLLKQIQLKYIKLDQLRLWDVMDQNTLVSLSQVQLVPSKVNP